MKIHSLKRLKMEQCNGFTKEEIEDIRYSLNEKTERALIELDRAKRKVWNRSRSIVLD